eukprot:6990789-Heterocapsa_arctica.AAC.1
MRKKNRKDPDHLSSSTCAPPWLSSSSTYEYTAPWMSPSSTNEHTEPRNRMPRDRSRSRSPIA